MRLHEHNPAQYPMKYGGWHEKRGTVPPFREDVKFKFYERYHARKAALIALKGGQCMDCGYKAHPAALEFDHVRGSKVCSIATLLQGARWEEVLTEVAKCELVCANCHAIRTQTRLRANFDKFTP